MELEFLKGELSAAVGIVARNRKAGAHLERARGTVSKNIRTGLEKIRSEDAVFGRYFAASIETGYYCAYLPEPDRKITWQLCANLSGFQDLSNWEVNLPAFFSCRR